MPGGCRRSNLLFGFLMAHLAATKEASEPFLHSQGCVLEDAEHFRCDRGGMSSTARVRAATAKEFSHFHTGVYCCTKGNLHTGRLDFLKFSVRSLLSTKQQYPRRAGIAELVTAGGDWYHGHQTTYIYRHPLPTANFQRGMTSAFSNTTCSAAARTKQRRRKALAPFPTRPWPSLWWSSLAYRTTAVGNPSPKLKTKMFKP